MISLLQQVFHVHAGYKEITKKYNISMQKCVNLINFIKTLDPKPGRVCSDEKSVYIQPDVVVEKIEEIKEKNFAGEIQVPVEL